MKYLFEYFTNRELATIIWGIIAFCGILFLPNVRKSLIHGIKSTFTKKLTIVYCLLAVYTIGIVFSLYQINLWHIYLLKDTTIWFFGFAIITFFNLIDANDFSFFKKLLLDSVKFIVIIEFVVNLYTFSFVTEMVMIPIIVFVALNQGFSENKKEFQPAHKLFTGILSVIGLIYLISSLYKTAIGYKDFFFTENLYSFLLPIVLTFLVFPLFYFLALYMKYEVLYTNINIWFAYDKAFGRKIKREIFKSTKLNLGKVTTINKKVRKYNLINSEDLQTYLDELYDN